MRCAAARIRPAIIICSALIPSLRGSRVLMMTHDTLEEWANIVRLFPSSPIHSLCKGEKLRHREARKDNTCLSTSLR